MKLRLRLPAPADFLVTGPFVIFVPEVKTTDPANQLSTLVVPLRAVCVIFMHVMIFPSVC